MSIHKMATYEFKNTIRIFNIGDVHRGNACCDTDFFNKTINYIKSEPDAYWVSTGDLLEAATKNSKSDTYEALNIQEELNIITEELNPIKYKCLGFVASNHHNRINNEIGLSLDGVLSDKLGIPFLGITGLLRVSIKNTPYYLCLHHGIGGGSSSGSKINNAMRISNNYAGADVYMSGHTHNYSHVPFTQQIISRRNGNVRTMVSHSIVTGHCLKWKDSYAEKLGLSPAPVGFAYIDLKINPSNRDNYKYITPGFFDKGY